MGMLHPRENRNLLPQNMLEVAQVPEMVLLIYIPQLGNKVSAASLQLAEHLQNNSGSTRSQSWQGWMPVQGLLVVEGTFLG